ncbi:hypothetical protein N5V81_12925 [Escherichia coli]|nr:hypothetical protein [Escherichia coli]
MGDRFIIQIPYNVIVELNQYLAQINELLADSANVSLLNRGL